MAGVARTVAFEGEDVAGLRARFLGVPGLVGKVSVAADEVGTRHALGRSRAREAGFEPVRGRRRHPRRGEHERLRAQGVPRRRAAEQAGVNQRTARDRDQGVKKGRNARARPSGPSRRLRRRHCHQERRDITGTGPGGPG
jgi:hypothetical protein